MFFLLELENDVFKFSVFRDRLVYASLEALLGSFPTLFKALLVS